MIKRAADERPPAPAVQVGRIGQQCAGAEPGAAGEARSGQKFSGGKDAGKARARPMDKVASAAGRLPARPGKPGPRYVQTKV